MRIIEDILAIYFATNAQITFKIAFLLTFPFAIINGALVDLKIFQKIWHRLARKIRRKYFFLLDVL